jgi:tellurite resistance protein TerC
MLSVWVGFIVLVLLLIMLDLGVFHRKVRAISIPEALAWTGFWAMLALLFNVFVFFLYDQNWFGWTDIHSHDLTGRQAAIQFFTGYLLEKSLSVDNIFVIAMIFAYFKVPLPLQHRVLYWGILGAIILRGIMIALGATLMARFDWIIYVFGLLLIISATKMLVMRHDNLQPENNIVVRLIKKMIPVTANFHESRFFVYEHNVLKATPLFLALILVETSDAMFAIDSIPAIFAVTSDPFLVFTSNIFAILGLRALYFAVAGMMDKFRYLKMSLVFILAYVGVKMMLSHHYPIPNLVSLAVIGGLLSVGVFASIFANQYDTARLKSPLSQSLLGVANTTYREAKRVIILIIGMTLVTLGVILLILPGPGLLTILLGLSLLAIEFVWARRWLARVRTMSANASDRIKGAIKSHRESRKDSS